MGTGTINSLKRYQESLIKKHKELDNAIDKAYSIHTKDETVTALKKEKLSLKEQIHKLETDINKGL
jgi:hypothetical protein|tara:strand:+ start:325 stop:522 length:198 start_codon:yes stop_codon:yes gene_type:complete